MFDRFDICDAYYLFACHWHRGQYSPEYRIFGRLKAIGYSPSFSVREGRSRGLSENARYILARLIRKARNGKRTVRDIDANR